MPIGSGTVYNVNDVIISQVSSSGTAFLETKLAAATSSLIYFDSNAQINSASLSSITVGTASYFNGNSISSSYSSTSSYSIYAETSSNAQNAQDILLYVKNTSGAIISKGSIVRIKDVENSSYNPTIELADFRYESSSANTVGYTNEQFAINGFGYVITEGKLVGVDTSAFTSGDLLYLSSSGQYTNVVPIPPNHGVRVGQVIRSNNSNGSIYVTIDNGAELDELHNVIDTSTTSSHGDLLVKSGSVWKNNKNLTGSYFITGNLDITQNISASATGSFGIVGIGTTSPSTKLAISDGTTIAQVNPFSGVAYFGTVNNYPMALSVNSSEKVRINSDGNVGIGTTSPAYLLDVSGSSRHGYRSADNHYFTGSVNISGSLNATASWAVNSVTASRANSLDPSNSYTVNGLTANYVEVTGLATIPTAGIYRPATKTLGLSADGTLILKISNLASPATSSIETGNFIVQSGNVGIGSQNPVNKLDVLGNISASVVTASLFFGTSSWANNVLTASSLVTSNNYTINNLNASIITASLVRPQSMVELYGYTEVARGLTPTITAGSFNQGGPTFRSLDSYWTIPSSSVVVPYPTMSIDLINPAGANQISYVTFGTYYKSDTRFIPYSYRIDTSTDNTSWTNQVAVTTNTNLYPLHALSGEFRYIRLIILSGQTSASVANGYASQVSSFRVLSEKGIYTNDGFWSQPLGGSSVHFAHPNNIGIGTTNPQNKLSLIGSLNVGTTTFNTAAPTNGLIVEGSTGIGVSNPATKLHVQASGGAAAAFLSGSDPMTATANAYIYAPVATGFSNSPVYRFWYQNVGIGNPASETLAFYTNNSEQVRVASDGNVGIGTSSPLAKLHVNSSVAIANFDWTSLFAAPTVGLLVANNSGSAAIRIATLDSNSTHDPYLNFLTSGGQNWSVGVDNSDSDKLKISMAAGFATNEFLTIDTSGNLGIGTTSPLNKLQVNGAISGSSFTSSISNAVGFRGTASWAVNSTTASSISSTGNVFIQGGNSFGTEALLGTNDNNGLTIETSGSRRAFVTNNGKIIIGDSTTADSDLNLRDNKILSLGSSGGYHNIYLQRPLVASSGYHRLHLGTRWYYDETANVWTASAQPNPDNPDWIAIDGPGSYLSFKVGSITGSTTSLTTSSYNDSERLRITTAATLLFNSGSDTEFRIVTNDSTNDPKLTFYSSSTALWAVGIDDSEDNKFKINRGSSLSTLNVLTINTSSNVGIGTTNPVNKLDVAGNISASVITASLFFGTSSWANNVLTASYLVPTNSYQITNLTSSNISASGTGSFVAVNIGTSTLRNQLTVIGPAQATSAVSDSGNGGGTIFVGSSLNAVDQGGTLLFSTINDLGTYLPQWSIKTLFTNGNGNGVSDLAFSSRTTGSATALTEQIRFQSNGNVGIGTTSPSYKLDVSGSSARINTSNGSGLILGSTKPVTLFNYSSMGVTGGQLWVTPSSGDNISIALGGNFSYNNSVELTYNTVSGDFIIGAQGSSTSVQKSISFWINNTSSMFITGSKVGYSSVGIGTTSPNSFVNSNSTYFTPSASSSFLTLYSKNNDASINLVSSASADNAIIGGLYFTRERGQTDAHYHIAGIRALQSGTSTTIPGGKLYFYTKIDGSGTETSSPQMSILANGYVGISAINPGARLHVSASSSTNESIILSKKASGSLVQNHLVARTYDDNTSWWLQSDQNSHIEESFYYNGVRYVYFHTYWSSFINPNNYTAAGGLSLGANNTNHGYGLYIAKPSISGSLNVSGSSIFTGSVTATALAEKSVTFTPLTGSLTGGQSWYRIISGSGLGDYGRVRMNTTMDNSISEIEFVYGVRNYDNLTGSGAFAYINRHSTYNNVFNAVRVIESGPNNESYAVDVLIGNYLNNTTPTPITCLYEGQRLGSVLNTPVTTSVSNTGSYISKTVYAYNAAGANYIGPAYSDGASFAQAQGQVSIGYRGNYYYTTPSALNYSLVVSGSVGIGTNNPTAKLHLSSSSTTNLLYLQSPNATDALFVSSSGRVGIGTTSPAASLEVVGSGLQNILRQTSATGYTTLRLYNDQNSAVRALEIDYSGASYSGALITNGPTGESACITTTGAYPLVLGTSNTARMTILSGGNVGIGTSSPSTKLQIGGTAASGGASGDLGAFLSRGVTTNFFEAFDGTKSFIGGVDNTQTFAKVGTLTNHPVAIVQSNGSAIYIDTSKNVGIGTITPNSKLEVAGNASSPPIISVYHTTQGRSGSLGIDTNGVYIQNSNNGDYFDLKNASGTSKFRVIYDNNTFLNTTYTSVGSLTASGSKLSVFGNLSVGSTYGSTPAPTDGMIVEGNVGIGTTSPSSKLDISGSSSATIFSLKSPTSQNIMFVSGSGRVGIGTNNPDALVTISGSTPLLMTVKCPADASLIQISGSGNIGIGTSAVSTYKLQVNGAFAASTKSFVIDHPTKQGKKLIYGSLESPYHGIRLTGKNTTLNGKCKVELPDYISKLILHDSVNIQLTGIKCNKVLYVDEINVLENYFIIAYEKTMFESYKDYDFFWDFTAIRADVPELLTEM